MRPRATPSGFSPLHRCDSGAVLMEYVILTCFVSIVVLTFMREQFYNFDQGYVGLGAEWASYVQLLHRAIAMPLP